MSLFSRSSKTKVDPAQTPAHQTPAQGAIQDLRRTWPVEVREDPMSRNTIIVVEPIVGALVLSMTVDYNFPQSAPEVRVENASEEVLSGLEQMVHCGLMDSGTGTIRYRRCFGWYPNMGATTFVFLVCLMIRTAMELTAGGDDGKSTVSEQTVISSARFPSSPATEGREDVIE